MSDPSKYHEWREIEDLPPDLDALRDRELDALSEVWERDKTRSVDLKEIRDLNAELAREWAIETGIIEGLYTLDRGTTQTLIERGIDSSYIPHGSTDRDPELVSRIIQSHAEVLEGLFSFVKGERELTVGYVKDLHASLLRHQDTVAVFSESGEGFQTQLDKGVYKKLPNNPLRPDGTLHEYCPPEHVASEMDRLVQLHAEHVNIGANIEAAWLHHRFTQIHPFQDGNGRVARAIASLVFIKQGFFPLIINRDDRVRYIDALEAADRGDLSELVRLFSRAQKRELTRAIGRAIDVRPVKSVDEAVAATCEMLVDLGRIVPKNFLVAKAHASRLFNATIGKLNELMKQLTENIGVVDPQYVFKVATLGGPPLTQILFIAQTLKYDPNTVTYHQTVIGTFMAGTVESKLVISFHGVGAFRGLLVTVGYFQIGDRDPVPICDDVFRISYQEPVQQLEDRYKKWLDDCLIAGIAIWRRSLL